MSEHLSEEQIDSYRAQTLSPAEKLLVARHLAACDQCNARAPVSSPAAFAALRKNLRPRAREDLHHLDYELMEAYVDERADAIDTEIIESHLELCADCAAELKELQAFAVMTRQPATRQEAAKPPAPSGWTRLAAWIGLSGSGSGWRLAGAAAATALVIVLATTVFIVYRSSSTGSPGQIAETRNTVSPRIKEPSIKDRNANASLPNSNAVIAQNNPPQASPYVIELARARGAGGGEVYRIPPDRDTVIFRATVSQEPNKKYAGRLVRPDKSFIPLGVVQATKAGKVSYSLRAARLMTGDYVLKIDRVPRAGDEDDEVASIPMQIRK